MSGIIDMIDSNEQSKKEAVATTVRMSYEISAQIAGLVDYLNTTKNDVMISLLKTALDQAYAHIEKKVQDDNLNEINKEGVSYYLVNTNKGQNINDHNRMLAEGHIELFGKDAKNTLKNIKKDDVVFLYVNGVGIVAYGKASGVIKKAHRYDDPQQEEYHYQELTGFKKLSKPLTIKEINKSQGKRICCLHSLSFLKKGEELLKLMKK